MLTRLLWATRTARPGLSVVSRALIEAICLAEGPIGPADCVAQAVGLRNRFELARLLRRDGVPPLRRLTGWATVLSWIAIAERDGTSLCEIALRAGRYPGACYRQVRDVTGLPWEAVKERGSAWVERMFLRELGRATPGKPKSPAAVTGTSTRLSGFVARAARLGASFLVFGNRTVSNGDSQALRPRITPGVLLSPQRPDRLPIVKRPRTPR